MKTLICSGLLITLTTLSACGDRVRTGKQGDVGSGGVQLPNATDSTVSHDSTPKKAVDTGIPPRPVR
jgi:hypothetical protein